MAIKHQAGSPYDLIILDEYGEECEAVEVTDNTISACQRWCGNQGVWGSWEDGHLFFYNNTMRGFVIEPPEKVKVIGGNGLYMYRKRHP